MFRQPSYSCRSTVTGVYDLSFESERALYSLSL